MFASVLSLIWPQNYYQEHWFGILDMFTAFQVPQKALYTQLLIPVKICWPKKTDRHSTCLDSNHTRFQIFLHLQIQDKELQLEQLGTDFQPLEVSKSLNNQIWRRRWLTMTQFFLIIWFHLDRYLLYLPLSSLFDCFPMASGVPTHLRRQVP